MQFVTHGPDVPETLLRAHEEGRVVFFCGAGISYPAGFPGFHGLVEQIYCRLHDDFCQSEIEKKLIEQGRYDTALNLLENRLVDGRRSIRQRIAQILTPTGSGSTETHNALLELSKNHDQRTRLITTNFDRLFEQVIEERDLSVKRYEAPLLPVPKQRWDGLIYLHGLLPENSEDCDLDNLVVSSGDFGLAYLSERWAARFVSELVRNFVLCFVGYSIDDPILRYMMDALAADRLLGESPQEMFAFGDFSNGEQDVKSNEWRAKNVTPILYHNRDHHKHLHETLRLWANSYRDGVLGKEAIVELYASANPDTSTSEDNFVGRVVWAICDPSGRPAKRFADFEPVPSLGSVDNHRIAMSVAVRYQLAA
ncbi:SIR2 family protein [Hoeflea sp.]|uniref:SIR2 family protein n=1 Tax=Hoeflea sp. TaxID=1940281 RepID=UPI003B02DF54